MTDLRWHGVDPEEPGLAAARLALHHAVQPVAAVGQSLLPAAADDSQQALALGPGGRWLGVPVGGGAVRAGLDPVALELLLCDGTGAPLASCSLAGRTVDEGLAFLAGELARRGVPGSLALPRHPADFPHHPLGQGARFAPGGAAARAALARLYASTGGVLQEVPGTEAAARLWPHHLDLAITLGCRGASYGLGFSPGDGEAGAPYWYATRTPPLPAGARPPLAGRGRWRESGWSGAELPLGELPPDGVAQRAHVAAFFASALAA